MAYDFPSSPTLNQIYTPAGGPTYQWNGYAWTTQGQGTIPANFVQRDATCTISAGYSIQPFNNGNFPASFTPNVAVGNYQYGNNNGAFTIQVPATDCAIDLLVINTSTAGAITFSGFTVGSNTGDPLTTANGSKFIISIRRIAGVSTYAIKALQ